MDQMQQALAAFTADLHAAAAERGVDLTPELMQHVFAESMENGFTPDATRAALDAIDYDEEPEAEPPEFAELAGEFANNTADEAARRVGRPLTAREQQALRDTAGRLVQGGSVDRDTLAAEAGVKSWDEMDPGEVSRVMAERARELAGDTGPDPDRVFDMDNDRDWSEYAALRIRGEEFDDVSEAA